MSKVFFLSYARPKSTTSAHALGGIDLFYRGLCDELANLVTGLDKTLQVGFRDAMSIPVGEPDWEASLGTALKEFPIGIILLSPNYLDPNRPWCRWECRNLVLRNEFIQTRVRFECDEDKPRTLIAIDWDHFEKADLPGDFPPQIQTLSESLAADDEDKVQAIRYVNRNGLRSVLDYVQDRDETALKHYRRFIKALAHYVHRQWIAWHKLARRELDLPAIEPYDDRQQWGSAHPTNASSAAKPRPPRDERNRVFVTYLAADPREVPEERAKRYIEQGGEDWKPFSRPDPVDNPDIDDLVRSALRTKIRTISIVHPSRSLVEEIDPARGRYPVLLFVDPWTVATVLRYRDALALYAEQDRDEELYSVPLAIWDDSDQDLRQIEQAFDAHVRPLFDRRIWETVRGEQELTELVQDLVLRMQRKIRNRRADHRPATDSVPPRIGATG